MNENNNNSEKQTKSSVVVKPKGKCAEFAVKIAGPMVIDGDGKPRDAYKPALDYSDLLRLRISGILMTKPLKK